MGVFARMSLGGRRGAVRGVLLAGVAVVTACPALAEDGQVAQAVAPQGRIFALAPQPLTDALALFGRQSGMQVSVDAAIIRGVSSPGVSGTMTNEQALRQLLSGTGITFRMNGGTAMLEKVAANGAMVLDPVTVSGASVNQAERATGPVQGYVATRTATATKTDTPILETPQSITVVGAEEMETRNVKTLEDAIKYTPGVQLSYGSTGDPRTSWYRMRGFPVTTSFYRDGMLVGSPQWQRVDPYLMERVEILRGPASVMYGQSIPGGMINQVTKAPQEHQMSEAAVEYGSFDWKRAEADTTGPIDEKGHWLYRVTAAAQDSDGLNGLDHDRNNSKVIAPAITWKPQEGTSLTLAALHQEDESRGWFPRRRWRTAAGTSSSSTYLGEPDYDSFEEKQNHLSLLTEHAVDDSLKFTLNARYSNYDLDYRQAWPGQVRPGGTTIARANYVYEQSGDLYTLDARVEKKLAVMNTRHTVLAGFDYLSQDSDYYTGTGVASDISLFNPIYGSHDYPEATRWSNYDVRSPGLYLQDQIEAGNWVIQLGGREDLAGSAANSGYKDTFSGRVGVAYKTGFGLVPYASYAESFEPQTGNDWNGDTFEPTTGRQYEVGAKYQPPGTNMVATVALFDLVKENVLTSDPDATHICNGSRCSVQVGEVTSRGVELGLTMGLADGLNAVASYTYNPVSVTKSTVASNVGRQQADTPIHTAALWMDYALQDGPLAGLGFGGGLRFLGRTTSSAGDVSSSPQLLDEAMVRYDVEDWRLSLSVKNILDRDIEYNCSRTANAEVCYLEEPLTITARVARKF